MATNLSTYASNKVLGHLFGEAAYPEPSCYLALFTTAPTMPAGTGGVEVTGGAYVREPLSGNMAAPSAEAISSNTAITWPAATASWGTVTAIVVYDAATNGNVLWAGSLTSSATINQGDTFTLPAGSFTGQLA